MSTTSPNMNLVIPGVGTESGPTWAADLNASLTLIDQHNHSSGQGVQIQPNGLNINSDLTFQSNNAYALRSTRFTAQNSALVLAADIGCVYVVGNELYYNDVTGGHQIQLTTNGSVNAGSGSINGLPSGTASASYSAGTFTWQSATSTAANMDGGSFIFRNAAANSKALTLQAPAAMATNFSLTLPTVPAALALLQIDTSGNITPFGNISGGITGSMIASTTVAKTNLAALGQQTSSSSGTFSTASGTFVDVTGLTVTITTTGRPVFIALVSDQGGGQAYIEAGASSATVVQLGLRFYKDSTTDVGSYTAQYTVPGTAGVRALMLPASLFTIDTSASAGSHTYKLQAEQSSSGSGLLTTIGNAKLIAFEL